MSEDMYFLGFSIRKRIIIVVVIVPLIIISAWSTGVFHRGLEFSTDVEAACKDGLSGRGEPLRSLTSPHLEVLLLLLP